MKEAFKQTIRMLAEDPFHPSLKSHTLSGQLHGIWAARISYQHRILFIFEQTTSGEILLIDIGSHEEVY